MSDEILPLIRKYRDLDASIKKVNKGLTDLRDERGEVEEQMREILQKPEYATFEKMALNDDSYIRIQREWNKPWSLSKKDLHILLSDFFRSDRPKTGEECYTFIVKAREEAARCTEMSFTRVERS